MLIVTVYVDVVFLENLCMNYIILLATGLIARFTIQYFRLLISSVIGSIYAVLTFTPLMQNGIGFFFKILLSVGMIYIAFQPSHFKKLMKTLLIFYLTSFAFGGCAFALLYFVKPQDIFMKDGVFIGTYPIKIALLGGIVGFVLIVVTFKVVKSQISKKDLFCQIELVLYQKRKIVRAMLDTGNLLKDPITHTPVIVVQKEELETLIPEQVLKNTENIIQGKQIGEEVELAEYVSRFRVIPYSSLGRQHGLLLGIKADKVKIEYQDNQFSIPNVIIGIYDKELSKSKKYTALVGLEILNKEGQDNESFRTIKV